jgi:hypothetical protein
MHLSTSQARGSSAIAAKRVSPVKAAPLRVALRNASYPRWKSERSQNDWPRGISMKNDWSVSSTAFARFRYGALTASSRGS